MRRRGNNFNPTALRPVGLSATGLKKKNKDMSLQPWRCMNSCHVVPSFLHRKATLVTSPLLPRMMMPVLTRNMVTNRAPPFWNC